MAAEAAAYARRLQKLSILRDKVDAPDEFFHGMVNRTIAFEARVEKLSEKETADVVIQMSADPQRKQDVGQALVCLMLSEKENSNKYIHLLSQMGDMWFQALYTLNMVTIEMFGKLNESCKDMLIVFFREAIKFNVPKLDSTFLNFVKTLNGTGDWNSRMRLARDFATLFVDCKDYMLNNLKAGSAFYGLLILTYSHIVADIATSPQHEKDKTLFAEVVVLTVRKRPNEAFLLGRDLYFALARISKVPKISELFAELIKKPTNFGIKGWDEVLFKSCHPHICSNRLSSDLVRKVEFMINGMRINGQSKHLEWFANQYLKGPDSASFRSELIRFVLFYFPQNQQVNIYEARMQFIYWIINSAPHGPEAQWCKTALWFDWLFCDPTTPIYALEPALAVVRYCIGVQATKASSLLEYLVKSVKEIYPPMNTRILQAANLAMKLMADFFASNNQPPVSLILENARVDANVREGVRQTFKDFVTAAEPVKASSNSVPEKVKMEIREERETRRSRSASPPMTRVKKTMSKEEQEQEFESNLNQLRDDFKEIVQMVRTAFTSEESDDSDKGESVGKLLQKVLENEDNVEEEQHWTIGHCLFGMIGRPEAQQSLVPEPNPEVPDPYQEIFSHPLFIVFRNLCLTPTNETTTRTPLIRIIAAMREKDNYITILLLYFIKCGFEPDNSSSDYIKCYQEVADASDKEAVEMLTEDLETMALEDEPLFSLLLPFVFEKFQQDIGSSPELLHVICCHMDSSQLSVIIGCLIREGAILFRKDNVCNLITASMDWSTTAQLMLWQLIHSESVPFDWLLPIVQKVKSEQHAETAVNLLLTLKRIDREPGMNLLRTILSRTPSKDDFFTINCFRVLIDDSDMCNKVAELVGQLIKKLINNGEIHMTSSQIQQKAQGKKVAVKLSLEQLLSHMLFFVNNCLAKERKVAEILLGKREVQDAFKTITSNDKTMMMKPKFQRLFSIMELLGEDSPQSSRTLRGNRGNNNSASKATKKKVDDDDDAPIPSKQKRRQVVTIDSDSD